MSHRNWQEFDEPGSFRMARLHVSMTPRGLFTLSRNAHEALQQPTHVVLLWDAETDSIGIRPAPPRTVHAFELRSPENNGSYRLYGRRFVRKHDIRLEYTVRFPHAVIEDGVLVLELKYQVRSRR